MQLRLKGDFSKLLEKLLFGTHVLEISEKLQNTEISLVTLLKSVSITDIHPKLSKIFGTLTGNFSSAVSFSAIIGGCIGQVELLKETLLKTFFWEFSKTFKTSFCEHPLKMYRVIFF